MEDFIPPERARPLHMQQGSCDDLHGCEMCADEALPRLPIEQWDTPRLFKFLTEAIPEVVGGSLDRNGLLRRLEELMVAEQFNGRSLLKMMSDISQPGAPPLAEHELFKRIFLPLGDDFRDLVSRNGQMPSRKVHTYVQTWLNELVLQSAGVPINDAKDRLFQTICASMRDKAFDCFYGFDDEWCIECGPDELMRDRNVFAGSYVSPCGWLRLAFKVPVAQNEVLQWHKAYHGTSASNIEAIAGHGLYFGDGRNGKAGAKQRPVIYVSPSLEYAAHKLYTKQTTMRAEPAFLDAAGCQQNPDLSFDCNPSFEAAEQAVGDWKDGIHSHHGTFVQCVFECRVRPGSYEIQGNTLGKGLWPFVEQQPPKPKRQYLTFDTRCVSSNLEWKIRNGDDIVCTGVMIRQIAVPPDAYNELRAKDMKNHVGWTDEEGPTRKREHGSQLAADGKRLIPKSSISPDAPPDSIIWVYNNGPNRTLARGDDEPWQPYPKEVSDVIEAAYQEYQRYVYIGKPPGAPGPYYIDFQSWCREGLQRKDHSGPEQRRADADREQDWKRRSVHRVQVTSNSACVVS